ncbi:lipase 3-like [Tetranychus urticae]|uniref:lipase 3-like n=1 Tax=Tetranychus urticae TaxID=32264 RepID=UPI00077BDA3B|nr:lipase 3-like [Tetranychus urticae]
MGSTLLQFFHLSIIPSFLLSLLLSSSYANVSYQKLPPPENPNFVQEQLILNPFKTTLNQGLTCGQLIVSRGFKYERHFVTTEDGYILQLYRIINPYAQAARGRNLKPILVLHGGFTSCSSFMINGPGGHIKEWVNGKPPHDTSKSLAFALANGEFDVWLGNVRGTRYSNHTRLDPYKDHEFWNYTFVEMGKYDVTAMVDYIIDETGFERIFYIGYSQGTMAIFTLLAKQPQFACKLNLNINVTPIAFIGDLKGIASVIPRSLLLTEIGSQYSGPLFPFLQELDAILSILCTNDAVKPICFEIYNYLFGPDREMVSPDQIKVLFSQVDQMSLKNFLHYIQSFKYDQIREFDYGPKTNLEVYGSEESPKFPFENVPAHNLVIISALNDYFAPPVSVQKLRNILPDRPFIDHVVTWPLWSHTDILLADEAFEYMHSVIIDIIRVHGEDIQVSPEIRGKNISTSTHDS